jgi:hypothetical protein
MFRLKGKIKKHWQINQLEIATKTMIFLKTQEA